jgi:hypothetical protein
MPLSDDQFCPVCKIENFPGATNCAFCNAPLGPGRREEALPQLPEAASQPHERGRRRLLLFAEGSKYPLQISGNRAVILGRNLEKGIGPQGETILDLSPFEALERGVSRRHAVLTPVEDGYEIYDMGSTNGSWLNQTRMLPGRRYRLSGESEVRLGRMVLRMVVRVPSGHTGTGPFSINTGPFLRPATGSFSGN